MAEKIPLSARGGGEEAERPTCIDIYCGAGGTTYGAMQAGLHVAYGLDRDAHAIRTFEANHPEAYADHRDVAEVTAADILRLAEVERIDYLLSGPNCQGVSQMGLFWKDDPRNLMFVHLARLMDEFISLDKAPGTVIVENVPSIAFKKNIQIVQDLLRFFLDRGYRCAADVVNFATWGLPQLRHRFILIATRHDAAPSLPAARASLDTGEGLVTTWDAIGDLAEVPPAALEETRPYGGAPATTDYQRRMRAGAKVVHNHHEGRTAPIDIQRISHVPQGGSWKDIPADLLPERFRKVRMTDYKTLYGRMLPDHPAYTIYAAYGNVTSGCFTHPLQDRPLTVREGCRLQGFPDDFVVTGSVSSQYRQIGNAVPAYAAGVLIEHWQAALRGEAPASAPMRLDEALLFGDGPLKLPVLTPRYRRIGYGSGTYWPKGWGQAPADMPDASKGYRIATTPVAYRRTGWRNKRNQRMAESLPSLEEHDWAPFTAAVAKRAGAGVLLDGIDTSGATPGAGKDLARQRFMRFLAPAGAAIASLASPAGRTVFVHCDFGLTADWMHRFLGYLIEERSLSLRVLNEAGDAAGSTDADSEVVVTTRKPGDRPRDLLVLAHPFTGANGFDRLADAESLPFPVESVRARAIDQDPFRAPP